MSFLLKFVDDKPTAAIAAALGEIKSKAATEFRNQSFEGEWATSGYGITSIRPAHIQAGAAAWAGSHHWGASYAASETWTAWVNITQTELAYELITGIFNLEAIPKTVEVYFTMAGIDLPTLNVEALYAEDLSRMFFQKPLYVSPSKPWTTYLKAVGGIGTERIGMLGYTVGTHSYLILRS